MLVLTRKPQETIRIGDDIVVTIIRTKGKAVRLGIEAPQEVPVLRGEIHTENHSPALDDRNTRLDDEQPTDGRVLVGRIPRSQASTIVPQLASTSGPLAAMLARSTPCAAE